MNEPEMNQIAGELMVDITVVKKAVRECIKADVIADRNNVLRWFTVEIAADDAKHRAHILRQPCLLGENGDTNCDDEEVEVYHVYPVPRDEIGHDKWGVPICSYHLHQMKRLVRDLGDEKSFFDLAGIDLVAEAQRLAGETKSYRFHAKPKKKRVIEPIPEYGEKK